MLGFRAALIPAVDTVGNLTEASLEILKGVLDSGRLGAVGAVSIRFHRGPHFGGFRDEMPFPLIIDMSIHHFDMMRYLLGREVTDIRGYSFNPAWSWFRGDATAILAMGLAVPAPLKGEPVPPHLAHV